MVMHELQATVEHDDQDDQDSLFGSPPPPQFEGRATSPALALPSAATSYKGNSSALTTPVSTGGSIINVGTIALTGSLDSEIPIDPLALSLNHGMVPRPPALPQKQSQTIAPSTKALSDCSAPPPVHFLRSQENLLGKAGRVGGIIPSTLPQLRGSTPSNPILIDDDDDTPMIGRRNGSKSRDTSQTPIDPIKLAQPTHEEIVSVLVGQKDIFPVLESILKLIAKGAQPKPSPPRLTGFERRPRGSLPDERSMEPPVKKRKLNRVPAGATDWDVPFPFANGEGPPAYHQNWEQDRGKRLIAELVKLIKVASRKAAAKKYIARQNRESQQTGGGYADPTKGYYRAETALYGRSQVESGVMSQGGDPPQLGEAGTSASGQPNQSTSSDSSLQSPDLPSFSPSQEEIQQYLDRLLSSFIESPAENANLMSNAATDVSQPPASSFPPTAMFDSWMSILDTFPSLFDATGVGTQVLSSETPIMTPLSARSTPGIDDFGLLSMPPDLDAVLNSLMDTLPPIPTPSASPEGNLNLFDLTSITPTLPRTSVHDLPSSHSFDFSDFATDPIPASGPLCSMPSTTDSSTFVSSSEGVTQPSSPLPSASSESQAMTPVSANWDLMLPDIFGDGGEGQGDVPMDLGRSSFAEKDLDVEFLGLRFPVMDKGKAKEVGEPSMMTKLVETAPEFGQPAFDAHISTEIRDELLAYISSSASSSTTSATVKSTKPRKGADRERQRRKEDIIRRAKEQRQEIQEELNSTKRQLWETTIEQAALIHLTKKLESEGEISKANDTA